MNQRQQPGQFKPYGEPVSNFSQQRSYGGLPRSVGPWGQMGGYYAKTQGVPTLPSVAPQSGGTRELFPLQNISGQFSSPMQAGSFAPPGSPTQRYPTGNPDDPYKTKPVDPVPVIGGTHPVSNPPAASQEAMLAQMLMAGAL